MKVSDFEQVIKADLVSPFILSKHIAKSMLGRKFGKIVNICYMMSELGRNTLGAAYAFHEVGLKCLLETWLQNGLNIKYKLMVLAEVIVI